MLAANICVHMCTHTHTCAPQVHSLTTTTHWGTWTYIVYMSHHGDLHSTHTHAGFHTLHAHVSSIFGTTHDGLLLLLLPPWYLQLAAPIPLPPCPCLLGRYITIVSHVTTLLRVHMVVLALIGFAWVCVNMDDVAKQFGQGVRLGWPFSWLVFAH